MCVIHPLLLLQINAEKSPYLTDKLKIWMLPTLALIKNEKVIDYVVGFDDLGGKDDFSTDALVERLARVDVVNYDATQRKMPAPQQSSIRKGICQKGDSDEDSDFD